MTYDVRYTAFVDILGFREIIRKSEHSPKMYDALVKVLTSMGSRDRELDEMLGDDLKVQNFSDAIVMSERQSPYGLLSLLSAVKELAVNLLPHEILIRGGVAKGNLHHDERVVFGPAFLEAYRLESNVAKFPRVLLSQQVYSDVQLYSKNKRWARAEQLIRLSDDGPAFVHILDSFERANRNGLTLESLNSEPISGGHLCEIGLSNLLKESMHEPTHFEKVRWFAIYWNSTVPAGADAPLKMIPFPNQP